MKKILIFLFILLNINSLTLFAQGMDYSEDTSIKVYDYAGLFSDYEEVLLSDKANEILERQNIDIAIVTADDLGGKRSMDYVDDFYDYNNFGYGDREFGLILLINMQDREIWISTKGEAIDLFNDSNINRIVDRVTEELSDGYYYDAGEVFLTSADKHISNQRAANLPFKERYSTGQIALVSAGIALAVSSIVVGIMYFMHRLSFSKAPNASVYSDNGGIKLFRKNDQFISTHTTRTAIPKDTGSGGSGGTSTHTSSSGSTHGGGGGKF